MRADKRKFHYIYKITRDDGRYYIGMHSTDDLEDGYFGSGKRITRSIKKHGRDRHKKEILEFLPSRESLRNREEQLVTEETVNDPLCMNIAIGGHPSGFFSEEHRIAFAKGARNATIRRMATVGQAQGSIEILRKIGFQNNMGTRFDWRGKKHSEETKQKMRKSKNVGEKNSQFGTCWVTRDSKPIKIKKEQLDEYLANGYSRGRK